jgi:hypothetical protein
MNRPVRPANRCEVLPPRIGKTIDPDRDTPVDEVYAGVLGGVLATFAPDREPPPLVLDHLDRLTGPHGLYEHADHSTPRTEHGYCVDDNARVMLVLGRLGGELRATDLYRKSRAMVLDGRTAGGWRNRLSADGRWLDELGSEDAHGRALWGLACHLARVPDDEQAAEALSQGFGRVLTFPRSIAYGVLGAAEVVDHPAVAWSAECFLERSAIVLPVHGTGDWKWPEDRLTYANARLPEAQVALGTALGIDRLIVDGLELLEWLVDVEWGGDHFSFTPTGGRGREGTASRYDQQPIEAWAMMDACRLAWLVTGDDAWERRARSARDWFFGSNDNHVWLYDPATGGGCDGLTADGRNENRGAESTLAALAAVADGRRHP